MIHVLATQVVQVSASWKYRKEKVDKLWDKIYHGHKTSRLGWEPEVHYTAHCESGVQ